MSIGVGGTPLQVLVASPHPEATVQTCFFGVHSGSGLLRCLAMFGGLPQRTTTSQLALEKGYVRIVLSMRLTPLHDGGDACKGRGRGTVSGHAARRPQRAPPLRRICRASAAKPPVTHARLPPCVPVRSRHVHGQFASIPSPNTPVLLSRWAATTPRRRNRRRENLFNSALGNPSLGYKRCLENKGSLACIGATRMHRALELPQHGCVDILVTQRCLACPGLPPRGEMPSRCPGPRLTLGKPL